MKNLKLQTTIKLTFTLLLTLVINTMAGFNPKVIKVNVYVKKSNKIGTSLGHFNKRDNFNIGEKVYIIPTFGDGSEITITTTHKITVGEEFNSQVMQLESDTTTLNDSGDNNNPDISSVASWSTDSTTACNQYHAWAKVDLPDGTEIKTGCSFNMIKLTSITVEDSKYSSNFITSVDKEPTIDLYVGEDSKGDAYINIYPNNSIVVSNLKEHYLWEIAGNDAIPDTGNFNTENGIVKVMINESNLSFNNKFTVKAGFDVDNDNKLDSDEITCIAIVHFVEFDKLRVFDKTHPTISKKLKKTSPKDYKIYVSEISNGTAIITLNPTIDNGNLSKVRSHVLWKVTGGDTPMSGNFLNDSQDIVLTPTTTKREFTITAGFDYDNSTNLDLSKEEQYKITVIVVKIVKIEVYDENHVINKKETTGSNIPDLYVGETASHNAKVVLKATILPDTNKARKHIRWKIDGNDSNPTSGTFESSSQTTITIDEGGFTPLNGNNNFSFTAGFDSNDNDSLSSAEKTHKVNVHFIEFDKLKIYDKNNPNFELILNENTKTGEICMWDNGSNTKLSFEATIDNNTPKYGKHVVWEIKDASPTPVSINNLNFSSGFTQTQLIAPSATNTARQFILKAGYDYNGNSVFDETSETLYTATITVVKVELINMLNFVTGLDCKLLKDDDGITMFRPQWVDNDCNGTIDVLDHNYPICQTKNTKMKVTATWKILPAGLPATVVMKCKGDGNGNLDYPTTVLSITGNNATATINCSNKLPNKVDIISPYNINWKIQLNNTGNWYNVGTTSNRVYVPWETPIQSIPYETVVNIGCSAATGLKQGTFLGLGDDTDKDVLDKIWNSFQSKKLRRISDNHLLTYYGYFDSNGNNSWDAGIDIYRNDPSSNTFTEYYELIENGNGQCHAWATLLSEVLKGQGISDINGKTTKIIKLVIKPSSSTIAPPYIGFAINKWATNGGSSFIIDSINAGIAPVTISALASGHATDDIGVSGQGTSPNPPSSFCNHYIIQINNKLYDPSYALGPFTDCKTYEDVAFAGRIKYEAGKYKLYLLPNSDGDSKKHDDEINTYSPIPFPKITP